VDEIVVELIVVLEMVVEVTEVMVVVDTVVVDSVVVVFVAVIVVFVVVEERVVVLFVVVIVVFVAVFVVVVVSVVVVPVVVTELDTVTLNVQAALLPATSLAVAVTTVFPMPTVVPFVGLCAIDIALVPQLSDAVAASKAKTNLPAAVAFPAVLSGHDMTGGCLSETVTLKLQSFFN
jgi:hypothetical protein